jgi:Ca-activated chloride channel family protein
MCQVAGVGETTLRCDFCWRRGTLRPNAQQQDKGLKLAPGRPSFVKGLLVLAVLAGAALSAQNRSGAPAFQSGIDLVSVTATVVGEDGRPTTGLSVEAFDLYEDGDLQTITQFTSERVPISLAVLLDASDSMFGNRLVEARAAVERFLFELLAPDDEFSVLAFNHETRPLTPWTQTPAVVRRAFEPLRPFGATAIYDALLKSLPMMEIRSRQRAGVVIISDGADTASDATLREVRLALLRSDTFVYAIAIDPPAQRAINRAVSTSALSEITDGSGGHTELVRTTADLLAATAAIADELNNQYVLGYSSARAPDGRFHSIRVRMRDSKLRVRARNGYIAIARQGPR